MDRVETIEKNTAPEAKGALSEREATIARGRAALDEAAKQKAADPRNAKLLEAVARFQEAVGLDPSADDAMGWLSKSLRSLAQSVRPNDPEAADWLLRCAAAIAWEARANTPPATLSGLTKQEAKTLLAWVRTTRHLSPAVGETAMDDLRAQHLADAMDLEAIERQVARR
ncbi:MAG: hypothetical protein ACM3JJ_11895 [Hyphomicrobiales bacterium]